MVPRALAAALALMPITAALFPLAVAGGICDHGAAHVAIHVEARSAECGASCEGNILLLGVAVLADNSTCTDCDTNLLNVGVSVVGDNDQCQASGAWQRRRVAGGLP